MKCEHSSLSVLVSFDKESYLPGDQVKATFKIVGKMPSGLRNIEFSLESGEDVTVRYSDGGDTKQISRNHFYARESIQIPPPGYLLDPLTVDLAYQLPPEPLIPLNTIDAKIFHRAHVKFNRKFRSDQHFYFPIPYVLPRSLFSSSRQSHAINGITASIDKGLATVGDKIRVELHSMSPLSARDARIELLAEVRSKIEGRKQKTTKTVVLDKARDIYEFPRSVVLPKFRGFSECKGKWVSCNIFVKIVLDRPLKRDINLKLPIRYIQCLAEE